MAESGQPDSVNKITRKGTAIHTSTKVTAQRQWALVVGTTNNCSTNVAAQRRWARVEGMANHIEGWVVPQKKRPGTKRGVKNRSEKRGKVTRIKER